MKLEAISAPPKSTWRASSDCLSFAIPPGRSLLTTVVFQLAASSVREKTSFGIGFQMRAYSTWSGDPASVSSAVGQKPAIIS